MPLELHPNAPDRIAKAMAVKEQAGHIYGYSSMAVKHELEKFYKEGRNNVEDYAQEYRPNPYVFQYDLEMHCFLNYAEIQRKELDIAIERGLPASKLEEIERFGFSGLTRAEHLFNACAIRWPTTKNDSGALQGQLVRHPWLEDDFKALSEYVFTFVFGGSGQGKTHGFVAFMCLVWDHFIKTAKGAKASFSTTSETKLKGVSWPYAQDLYQLAEGREEFSLYAGKGKIAGEYTIKRPGAKFRDTGGVFKGILVGNQLNQKGVIDKLTGTHGFWAFLYLIDEIQSTPEAPIKASTNYLSTPKYAWVMGAGNYGDDSDSLGKNVKPKQGWENVDKTTHIWESFTVTKRTACVIHKNNSLSPAMEEPWATLCPFLPNKRRWDENWSSPASRETDEFRRFWEGWRGSESAAGYILNAELVKKTGAGRPFLMSDIRSVTQYESFDSAPGNVDRNILMNFADGYTKDKGQWIWGFRKCRALPKSEDDKRYYRESSKRLIECAKEDGARSGNMITDWTNRGGHPEFLAELQYEVYPLVYNEACPDGERLVARTGVIEPAVIVGYDSNGMPNSWAHSCCADRISFGAFALRKYVSLGVVRGINPELTEQIANQGLFKDFEQEIYRRIFTQTESIKWGSRNKLEDKKLFIKRYGFSPDVLDTMFQAAFFMAVVRRMPLDKVFYLEDYDERKPVEEIDYREVEIDKLNKLWEADLENVFDESDDELNFESYAARERDIEW